MATKKQKAFITAAIANPEVAKKILDIISLLIKAENMKKTFFILFISFLIISAVNKEDKIINRTIMIMPIYNLKKSAEFDYLTDVIRDAIRAKLDQKNLFNFIDYNEIDESIKKIKLKDADLINEKKSLSEFKYFIMNN